MVHHPRPVARLYPCPVTQEPWSMLCDLWPINAYVPLPRTLDPWPMTWDPWPVSCGIWPIFTHASWPGTINPYPVTRGPSLLICHDPGFLTHALGPVAHIYPCSVTQDPWRRTLDPCPVIDGLSSPMLLDPRYKTRGLCPVSLPPWLVPSDQGPLTCAFWPLFTHACPVFTHATWPGTLDQCPMNCGRLYVIFDCFHLFPMPRAEFFITLFPPWGCMVVKGGCMQKIKSFRSVAVMRLYHWFGLQSR